MKGRNDSQTNSDADRDVNARVFVRALNENHDAVVSTPAAEQMFCGALHAVEMTKSNSRFRRTDCNHIYFSMKYQLSALMLKICKKVCRGLCLRYAARCLLLHIFVVEVKVCKFYSECTNYAAYLPLRLPV
jgi:Acetyl-CoA carboxylase, central region